MQLIEASPEWMDYSVSSVGCASMHSCMLAGDFEGDHGCTSGGCDMYALVERWNGTRWARLPEPKLPAAIPNSASCSPTTGCVLVGIEVVRGVDTSFAARWNGSKWTVERMPGVETSVSCSSENACVGVGTADASAPAASRWNGQRWQAADLPVPRGDTQPFVDDVSCAPNRTCFAVGSTVNAFGQPATLVERWHRSRWSILPSANYVADADLRLEAVSWAAETFCGALGSADFSAVWHGPEPVEQWNGSDWSIRALPQELAGDLLASVSCPTTSMCAAVTYGDGELALIDNNGHWSFEQLIPPSTVSSDLSGVSCASSSSCMAVGSDDAQPLAEMWNGTAWSK